MTLNYVILRKSFHGFIQNPMIDTYHMPHIADNVTFKPPLKIDRW